MTPSEAHSLALTIVRTWPRNAVAGDLWQDALEPLHQPRALEAYRRLRDEAETAPSIARFRLAYNALHSDAEELEARTASAGCAGCDGTGYVTGTHTSSGHEYEAVCPCTCPAGQLASDPHARRLRAIDADRRSLGLSTETPTIRLPQIMPSRTRSDHVDVRTHVERLRVAAIMGDPLARHELQSTWTTTAAATAFGFDTNLIMSLRSACETPAVGI